MKLTPGTSLHQNVMPLTENEKNRLYYQKHRERVCEAKHEYQMKNKDKIALLRKNRRIAKMREIIDAVTVTKTEVLRMRNIAQTRMWWGEL